MTGAPGAGKTALVCAWAGVFSRGPIAWLDCEHKTSQERFWPSLLQAVSKAGVGCDQLDAADPAFLDALAAKLTEFGDPVVLVLDDFSAAPRTPVSEGIAYLLAEAQPTLRLVLTARQDPPLPLHRYKLAQELTEIRADALAFNEREIRELLEQHKVELPASSLTQLRERTEGWAAGVRLAAMSMESQPDPQSFVERFAGDDRAVVDYLIEEVLSSQPPEVRRALLASSIAGRFNAELVAELCDGAVEGAFAEMIRNNAFLLPQGGGWYRHQRLFGEAMRVILRHESPGEAAALHSRAAAWFGRHGLLPEAVHHATEAADGRYACRLVVDRLAIGEVIGLGADRGLADQFRQYGEAVTGTEPEPDLVMAAAALSEGDDLACKRSLGRAQETLANLPAEEAFPARLAAAVIQLTWLLRARPGDPELATRATEAEGLLDRVHRGERPELQALVSLASGMADLQAGRHSEAIEHLGMAVRESADCCDFLRKSALAYLSLAEALHGRFARASELAVKAAQLPEICPPPGRRVPAARVASAWTHLEAYELSATRHELDRAAVLQRETDATTLGLYWLVRALMEVAEHRIANALGSAQQAEQAAADLPWLRHRAALNQAVLNLSLGDPHSAFQAFERAGETDSADARVTLARICLWDGDHEAAVRALRPALSEAVAMPLDVRVDAWLLDAFLGYETGDVSRGRRSLDRALRLGQREHIRLPFAESREWLYPVLRNDPELIRGYQRLLEPLGLGPARRSSPLPEPQGALSSRELDVLRCLTQMMTTEEIAQQMYLSANTVKTHLKSIYRKLAVTRRGDAVRRARQLNLL